MATALPAIEHDLHARLNWSGWTITIHALGQVIAMPMAGKISDMYGRKKVFAVSAAVFTLSSLYGAAALGFAALVPLYAQDRYHIAPLGAGTLLTARAVGMIAVAGVAAMTLRRTGYRLPMIIGIAVLAAGLLMMSLSPVLSAYAWLAIAAALTGCGMGLSVPASNNASLQLAPDQVAAIAGLRGMFRQSGSDHRRIRDHGDHRQEQSARARSGPCVRGLRSAARCPAAVDQAGSRPSAELLVRCLPSR